MSEGLPEVVGGRYEVVRLLGEGGMGRVLLARDGVLGREVAIKILRDDIGLPKEVRESLIARMRQEARAAAALSHPSIVTLHDMGEDPAVGLFLVFERIDGPTLRERISEGPLPPRDVATLARALGEALTHAHEAGVIHRDVKPENVMSSRTGPKLTDLGIARVPDSKITRAGSVLGTPAYSAPEALAVAEFGPESDQFSLAVTLFEALSGRRAFDGDDALQVATRIATGDTPRLALAMPGDAAWLARVDGVLGRALSKSKAARYPSCAAFGEALDLALREPPPSRADPAPRAVTGPVGPPPRRWQNVVVAALVIAAAASAVWMRRGAEREARHREDAGVAASAAHPHGKPPDPRPARPRPAPSAVPDASRDDRDAGQPPREAPSNAP